MGKGAWWMPWHQEPMKGVARLRKASVSCLASLSRGFPNGATRSGKTWAPPAEHIGWEEVSRGSETSQYPEEKKLFS